MSYRVVSCDTEAEWLEARRWIVTASDVATVMGDNPWRSPEELLENKLRGVELEMTQAMWYGRMREANNLRILEALSPLLLEGAQGQDLYISTRCPALGATLDGKVRVLMDIEDWAQDAWDWAFQSWGIDWTDLKVGAPVELKNVASKSRSKWTKPGTVPLYYWWQVQAQLYVTGHEAGLLVAAVDACEMYPHVIYASVEAQEAMCRECEAFVSQLQERREDEAF